jgi:hypothetical protein
MFISVMETLSEGGVGVVIAGLALIFMALALIRTSPEWMIAAALLTVPYTYTAGAWSGVLLLVRLLPLTQLLAAYAISKEETLLAGILAVPTLLTLGYSLYDITINQDAFRILMN